MTNETDELGELTDEYINIIDEMKELEARKREVRDTLEDKIKEMSEVDEIKSISMTGLAIVTPIVHPSYTDMEPIWADLVTRLVDAEILPDDKDLIERILAQRTKGDR